MEHEFHPKFQNTMDKKTISDFQILTLFFFWYTKRDHKVDIFVTFPSEFIDLQEGQNSLSWIWTDYPQSAWLRKFIKPTKRKGYEWGKPVGSRGGPFSEQLAVSVPLWIMTLNHHVYTVCISNLLFMSLAVLFSSFALYLQIRYFLYLLLLIWKSYLSGFYTNSWFDSLNCHQSQWSIYNQLRCPFSKIGKYNFEVTKLRWVINLLLWRLKVTKLRLALEFEFKSLIMTIIKIK